MDAIDAPVEFNIFSADMMPDRLHFLISGSGTCTIRHHGFVPSDRLQTTLAEMDFGLVALDKSYDLPAFPSKIMAYTCAGLPILLDGPSCLQGLRTAIEEGGIGIALDRPEPIVRENLICFRRAYPACREAFLSKAAEGPRYIAKSI